MSPDLQYYRLSLTPSLLEKVHPNIKAGFKRFALLKLTKHTIKSIWKKKSRKLPKEFHELALVYASAEKENKRRERRITKRVKFLDYLARELGIELIMNLWIGSTGWNFL
jgi:hypothetical protein